MSERLHNIRSRSVSDGSISVISESGTDAYSSNDSWAISVPEAPEGQHAVICATLGADDLATLSVGNLSLVLGPRGPYGGGTYSEIAGEARISAGVHKVFLSYSNISLPPEVPNVALLNYSLWVEFEDDTTGERSGSYVPQETEPTPIDNDDDGEDEPCDERNDSSSSCPCPDEEDNGDGDNGESSSNPCENNAGGVTGADGAAVYTARAVGNGSASSSAGKRVTARGGLQDMLWRCNFASFRGMQGLPDGYLVIQSRGFSDELWSPAALCFDHPLASQVIFEDTTAGVRSGTAFQILRGSRRINGFCYADGKGALLGGSAKRGGRVSYGTEDGASFVEFRSADGAVSRYAANSAAEVCDITSYTPENGPEYTRSGVAAYLNIIRAEDGSLRQIMNAWDGLMSVEDISDTGYRMAFYLPSQVGEINEETGLYEPVGEPFRTVDVAGDTETGRLTVTETASGRTPFPMSFFRHESGAWCTVRGEGEDAVYTLAERTALSTSGWQLITRVQRGENGTPVSCICETWQSSSSGYLCMSRTEGYGTDYARETTYDYDSEGRKIKETAPNGSSKTWAYDDNGRETVRMEPYPAGGRKAVYTYYRQEDDAGTDPLYRRAVLTARAAELWRTDYTYTEENNIRRTVASTTALGAESARTEITETWLGTADALLRGRTRMRQGHDGVQTWYDYEYCSEPVGTLYRVTAETRIDGATVPGQSRRSITYVSAEGNNLRRENHLLLSSGVWVLTAAEDYTYDTENRWCTRTRANGRTTVREMMCCGPLRVTDEDGVTYSYSYDTARQMTEMIRSEVSVGETVISPETITTYTRNAAGAVTQLRTDTGVMCTVRSYTYDLCGRLTGSADELGRTTTYAYSADGLTETVTTAAGATLITERHASGAVLHRSGTGQREVYVVYDILSSGTRTTEKTADNSTITAQRIDNGFGQTVVTAEASTSGFIYTRNSYDSRGRLTERYRDTGSGTTATAPVQFGYDDFGNVTSQVLALAEEPTADNSAVTTHTYTTVQDDTGIFLCVTTTRNNADGTVRSTMAETLVSETSTTVQQCIRRRDERGNTAEDTVTYGEGTLRYRSQSAPDTETPARQTSADGFITESSDHAGNTATFTRTYTASGSIETRTDGRGNTITEQRDIAGRIILSTDAAGNSTATAYDPAFDLPSCVTDAAGNTVCRRYDLRGRLAAEWGTGTQPTCYQYDDADRPVTLTTFRASTETISSDPGGRGDGDCTYRAYHDASGLMTAETHADGTYTLHTYNAYNRPATVTDARGRVATYTYEHARGLLTALTFSDDTPSQSFTYNHVGQLTGITDAAGTRTLGYNAYAEQETDSLLAGTVTHLITETRDAYGRSTGFTYTKGGTVQHTVTTGYGTDGRIATAGFLHGGAERQFGYTYLPGSNLLQTLTAPNNMTLTLSYEEKRDLLTGMYYKHSTTGVVEREYSYDVLGRPLTRRTARNGSTVSDTFAYNTRSELTSAAADGCDYNYSYDNIGNRSAAVEDSSGVASRTEYTANNLNQYTAVGDFVPGYDADGNQTSVKTATGIWTVEYNAEKRPVSFTRITCTYDYRGRRSEKKVETVTTDESGAETVSVDLHHRYIYRDYLQVACCDLTRAAQPCLWLITWDPTQSTATRPLAIRKDGTWCTYGWDITKNICEVFGPAGYIRTSYTYSPYGSVTIDGETTQTLQWSSEFADSETALVYYNYRYYNPSDGRWISRDILDLSFIYCNNATINFCDVLGLYPATFKGFENPRYQQHDELIEKLVNDFNLNKAEYAASTQAQAEAIPDLSEDLIKSMMIQETGGNDRRSKAAWDKDPLQVNVPGDFGEEKKCLGLKCPKRRNEGNLEDNVRAAIKYLTRKGYGRSGKAPKPTSTFDGWEKALERYNGRSDKVNGRNYSEVYAKKISARARDPQRYEKIETK